MPRSPEFDCDVVVIGGGGHVGLPLSIALADAGSSVVVLDVNPAAVEQINSGVLPFDEPGAIDKLRAVVSSGRLTATIDPSVVSRGETVVIVIGTPVDEHLNPDPVAIPRALAPTREYFRDGQLVVLRSTVFPGVTALVERMFEETGTKVDVVFCPERIAEGQAMTELYTLPQIVSGRTSTARARAAALFGQLTGQIVELETEEAELAKLFTNVWRYIKFAAANQFYMIANSYGLDYDRIRQGLAQDYPRAADMPRAGFAAGPCLFKDTMQLAAFNDNNFHLGHSAMLVNEGMPLYVVRRLGELYDLPNLTVGILGMAFKAESDDVRSSLSYKLKRLLAFRAGRVLTTDPYVTTDPSLLPLTDVLEQSDLLVVGAPHKQYSEIVTTKPVADVWNIFGNGVRV